MNQIAQISNDYKRPKTLDGVLSYPYSTVVGEFRIAELIEYTKLNKILF